MKKFYGHGKLLLTGEYFVLDGAEALAVPTKLGQHFSTEDKTGSPSLSWKSYDDRGYLWLEATFYKPNFSILHGQSEATRFLQKILIETRKLNPDFFTKNCLTEIKTNLEFPRKWGLGSSSTLIHCLAAFAEIDEFELLKNTFGGSGYDLACAGADVPILYQIQNGKPTWKTCEYQPVFSEKLFFVYLGKKQNSREGIKRYREKIADQNQLIDEITDLTKAFLNAKNQPDLEQIIREHEQLVASTLELPRAKDLYFKNFEGEVKSLGAWGGDFVLVTNPFETGKELRAYFFDLGFETISSYEKMLF